MAIRDRLARRLTDPMRGQGNPIDQIENSRGSGRTGTDVMIDVDLEHVEPVEVLMRPRVKSCPVADTDRGRWHEAHHYAISPAGA